MDRSWVYRVITYALITLAAFVMLVPSVAGFLGKDDQLPAFVKKHLQKKILLGLDLQSTRRSATRPTVWRPIWRTSSTRTRRSSRATCARIAPAATRSS